MNGRLDPLRITRLVSASPDQIFRTLTDESLVPRWFGPRHIQVVHVDLDVRIDGRCRWEMLAPDGTLLVLEGKFEIVEPPYRLVWTNAWEHEPELISRIDVNLRPGSEGTLIEVIHEDLPEAHAEEAIPGWEDTLDRLAALVGEVAG